MITNRYNLPQQIVKLVEDDDYQYTPHRYSVTEVLNSTKEIILRRRHKDKLIIDVADRVNMIFGTAFHSIMEEDRDSDEIRVSYTYPNGVTISGRIDKYIDYTVRDYKTSSVYKIKSGNFDDWEQQGLLYALVLTKQGKFVDRVEIIAFIKDYSVLRKDFDNEYPESAIYTHEVKVTSDRLVDTERWLISKLNEIEANLNTPDNLLPTPTDAELWKDPTTYAVFKYGSKRATKIYDNRADAEAHGGDYIEERVGEYKKLLIDNELRQLWKIAEGVKND